MVRTREKKPKGDSAFTTRKQKVGRKKLAPATSTRAEVHARTLHITKSTSMAHATAPLQPQQPQPSNTDEVVGKPPKRARVETFTAVQRTFAELLASTHHYKSSQRASAFGSMARLLAHQMQADREHAANDKGTACFLSAPSASLSPGGYPCVTPLEKLKAFTAALDAMTDTEDDVRRAALSALHAIVRDKWLCSSPTTSPAGEDATLAVGRGCDALLLAHLELHLTSGSVMQDGFPDMGNGRVALPGVAMIGIAEADRTKAMLQAVHVSLTHAMKSVRLSGVALLDLLLHHARPGAVRQAARLLWRQQQASLSPQTAAALSPGSVSSPVFCMKEEEEWMLAMVKRVSALVLRTGMISTLPALLEAFLIPPPTPSLGMGRAIDASACSAQGGAGASVDLSPVAHVNGVAADTAQQGASEWQNPVLVRNFLEEMLSPWSNAWKELVELQVGLLRQEEKLRMAVALAQSFAVVLIFLRKSQLVDQQRERERRGVGNRRIALDSLLPRMRQRSLLDLLFNRMPVSTMELLRHCPSSVSRASGDSSGVQLALALARVAVPLASTEEGWRMLYQYFTGTFQGADNSAGPSTPFVFPSLKLLLNSLEVFREVLDTFPVSVLDGDAGSSSSSRSVVEKLLLLCPSLLHGVLQWIRQHPNLSRGHAHVLDDALLAQVFLSLTRILSRAAVFPLHAMHSGSSAHLLPKALVEVFSLVPRFLFSLRMQYAVGGPGETVATGLLTHHPWVVDVVVYLLLRVLWFVGSSGHPLLAVCESKRKTSSTAKTPSLAQLLCLSLPSLFGMADTRDGQNMDGKGAVVEGVLARCGSHTAELARHVLFYLGVDSGQPMVVMHHPQKEGSVVESAETYSMAGDIARLVPPV